MWSILSRIKEKKPNDHAVDAEEAFSKIQYRFMVTARSKLGIENFNLVKNIYQNTLAQASFSVVPGGLLSRYDQKHGCSTVPLTFPTHAVQREKETSVPHIGKDIKLSVSRDGVVVPVQNPKNGWKRLKLFWVWHIQRIPGGCESRHLGRSFTKEDVNVGYEQVRRCPALLSCRSKRWDAGAHLSGWQRGCDGLARMRATDLSLVLVGTQESALLWKTAWQLLAKRNILFTIWLSSCAYGYLLHWSESVGSTTFAHECLWQLFS